MPLNLTKVAYGAQSLEQLLGWFAGRSGSVRHSTRYRPKRHAEIVGGSLYWIVKHRLVARCAILGFEDAEGGRTDIVMSTQLIRVRPVARRAHQGWRYLEPEGAPPDLGDGEDADALPPEMQGDLAALGLL